MRSDRAFRVAVISMACVLCSLSLSYACQVVGASTKVSDFDLPGPMVSNGTDVWVVNKTAGKTASITEVNVESGKVVRVITAGNNALDWPTDLALQDGRLWVTREGVPGIAELDASNGALVQVIKLKTNGIGLPTSIAAGDGKVWVGAASGYSWITELNASSGAVVRVINSKADELNDSDGIAVESGHVWIVNSGGDSMTELKASSGSLMQNIKLPGLFYYGLIVVSGFNLWVLNTDGFVTEINASNGSRERTVTAKAGQFDRPVSLAASGADLWITNLVGNSVSEISATSGALVRVINARNDKFDGPDGIVVAGSYVWISNLGGNSVTELNASNGSLVRVIK